MRRMLVCAAVAAYAGLAGTAMASDIYEGSLKDEPAPLPPVAIWSGLYVGGTVGFGSGDTSDELDIDVEDVDGGIIDTIDTFLPTDVDRDIVNAIEAFLSTDYDMDGAVYGVFLGYNWQHENAVFGVEAGFNGTDFDGHTDCVIGLVDCNRELDYYGRVVGRLGYAVNNIMFYGFGGVAWGDVETKISAFGESVDSLVSEFSGGEVSSSFNEEQTHVGWTAGAGIEFAFTERFFAGVEYAHVDLGEERYKVFSDEVFDTRVDIDNKVDVSFDVIKIRASYKLWHRGYEPVEPLK